MKKLPPGKFLDTKLYQFVVPEGSEKDPSGLSPSFPCKTMKKPENKLKSEKIIKKPKKNLIESSVNSSSTLGNNKLIEPNYPKPIIRDSQGIKKEKTVADILFEYQEAIETNSMMPLQPNLNPHILETIQRRPFSAGSKAIALYDKNKAKTITEIRTQEKFQGKANAAVNVWLQQIEQEKHKSNKIAEANIKRFKRSENKLSSEITQLMSKIQSSKLENQASLSELQSKILRSEAELSLSSFKLNGHPVKPKPNTDNNPYATEVKVYNSNPTQTLIKNPAKSQDSPINLISDDESFLKNIESIEDFEIMSDSELN
jgi:hypothetical protein